MPCKHRAARVGLSPTNQALGGSCNSTPGAIAPIERLTHFGVRLGFCYSLVRSHEISRSPPQIEEDMKPTSLLLPLACLLASCASTPPPVPAAHTGPTVTVFDTGFHESSSKGAIFAVIAIDGTPVENSLGQTRSSSLGTGFTLNSRYLERKVAIGPMKLTLVGTHMTGASIHEIAARMAGTFFRVEGVVEFRPIEGHEYGVTGELKAGRSCVWVADAGTSVRVTDEVCAQ